MSNHPAQRSAVKHQSKRVRTNIFENENEWTIDLLVPGYAKSDFAMDVKDGVLTVSASKEKDQRKFIKKEFGRDQIERSFTLPKNAASDNISAKLDAGVLSIVIPKSEEAKPKTINIK